MAEDRGCVPSQANATHLVAKPAGSRGSPLLFPSEERSLEPHAPLELERGGGHLPDPRLPLWASSIGVDANATPLDPPGDPEVDVTRRTPICARAVRDDAAIRGKQRCPSRVPSQRSSGDPHDASLSPPRQLGSGRGRRSGSKGACRSPHSSRPASVPGAVAFVTEQSRSRRWPGSCSRRKPAAPGRSSQRAVDLRERAL